MAIAIKMPPQAMKGMAYETPVNKCCRRLLSNSGIELQCYEENLVHFSCKIGSSVGMDASSVGCICGRWLPFHCTTYAQHMHNTKFRKTRPCSMCDKS